MRLSRLKRLLALQRQLVKPNHLPGPPFLTVAAVYDRRYRCYPLLSGDLDLLWLQLFLLRKDDLQDAIFVVGANLLVVHRCRDGKRAAESAVGALDPMVVFLFSLLSN